MKDWIGNKNSIYKTLGASNHTDKEREKDDYYATDPIAIDKLLAVENISPIVWECACGEGHLSKRLKQYHKTVFSTDIVDRGYKDLFKCADFLSFTRETMRETFKNFTPYMNIITNPPYKYAKEFVLKALELLQPGFLCCMFLKLTFLEGKSRFYELFKNNPPKTVYVFSERILCAKNARFDEMKASGGSAVAYAWFVWEKGYKGVTQLKWI